MILREDLFLYNCLQGFAASVDAHSAGIRAAFEAVRVRLGEMADFLQRLLSDGGDGLLNASALSNCSGVMEMLQRSLEESRRMSQSLLLHEHTGTNCIKIGLPGKLDSQSEKRSSGSPILLKTVSENQFSGKTNFYTIVSR